METYYAHYNAVDGTILGFYTATLHGDRIPLPNIGLTEEEWRAALSASYRVVDGALTLYEPPPYVPTTAERIAALTAEYEPQFEPLRRARVSAQAAGWGESEVASIDAEYRELLAEFNARMEEILNGD